MGHAAVENATSHACEHLFLADEEGRSLLVVLVQATFEILGAAGLGLAEKAVPPSLTGELWGADAAVASYKIEPAFAFMKPATDVVLLGHAQAGGGLWFRSFSGHVPRRAGRQDCSRSWGDQFWVRAAGVRHWADIDSQPFDRMPLIYERAFGGWDRSPADAAKHTFEPRNPVGVGFRGPEGRFEERLRLPNIEDPTNPIQRFGQVVAPRLCTKTAAG